MSWHPKETDLTAYMAGRLEEAYQNRERPRCSRDDFMDGFLAAMTVLMSKSSFRPGRWEAVTEEGQD